MDAETEKELRNISDDSTDENTKTNKSNKSRAKKRKRFVSLTIFILNLSYV